MIKFTKHESARHFFYNGETPLYWFSIDTADSVDYDEIPQGQGQTDIWMNRGISSGEITCGIRGYTERFPIGQKVLFAAGQKIFVPLGKKTVKVTSSAIDYRMFESNVNQVIHDAFNISWGTDFIIDVSHADIILCASHCPAGYSELTVTQYTGKTATIYDKFENIIFDGSSLGEGKWKLTCIFDTESTGVYQYSGSPYWCYDGTNEMWVIEQLE